MDSKKIGLKRAGVMALALAIAFFALPRAYSAIDRTYEQLKLLVDVLDYVKENYYKEVDTKDLIYGAASGMIKTLDPFSQFMEPEVHKEIKTETEGEFGGLGIRIGMRDDWLTVITPLPGTPAFKAGMLPGDRVIKIEGESTRELSLFDAVKKLRGKPGSSVTLTIAREPEKKEEQWMTKDFTLTREVVKIESVKSKLLADKIGYMRILEFSGHTSEDVHNGLADMKKQGMQALVLDLRNNPGGLLSAAVDVSSQFIGDNKMIVYTQGRRPESKQEFRAGAVAPYGDVPMVLLVNGGSASGSEIVAGALQDHARAVLLGSRTFGKASVQSVIPLTDGSGLRLTVALYYTPAGRSIMRDHTGKVKKDSKEDEGGIMPDIVIDVPREVEAKIASQTEEIFTPDAAPAPAGKDAAAKEAASSKKEEKIQDVVLERGLELLRARDILTRLKHL